MLETPPTPSKTGWLSWLKTAVMVFVICAVILGTVSQLFSAAPAGTIKTETADDYYQAGLKNLQAKQWEQAYQAFTKCIEKDPKMADAYFERTFYFVQVSNLPAAMADLDKVIELKPTYAAAYVNRAKIRLQLSKIKSSTLKINQAIQSQAGTAIPASANPLPELSQDFSAQAISNGVLIKELGNDLALLDADLNQAIKLQPTNVDALSLRASFYQDRSLDELALQDYTTILQVDSQNTDARLNRANPDPGFIQP
ncbi:MAG: hypothetical protein NT121_02845 [Chloroflexi bacterium]|nr:hypothetical protein [Chloroflexota bacterium]